MRRQLTFAAAAIASMIVVAFLVPLGLLVRTLATDRALAAAQQSANALVPVVTTVRDRHQLEQVVAGLDRGDPSFVSVVGADGSVVGTAVDESVIGGDLALARTGRSFSADEPGGVAIYVPVVQPGRTDVIRSFVPEDIARRGVGGAWLVLALLGVALVGVATFVADRLARSIVRPVNELAEVAESLGRGDLDERVEPGGPHEIVEVGRTLNQLADRIEGLLAAERESVADLSHRLRTPVTALRLDAEGVTDPEERQRLADDVEALEEEVSRVITMARRGSAVSGPKVADLVAVARERVEFWGALADDQGRPYELLTPDGDGPMPVPVDAEALSAALDALLGNVLAHTEEGVGFRVLVRRKDGSPQLVLDDDGPGIDGDDALRRGRSGGGSTGLGLDIVRQLAERAGGGLRLDRAPGGGARVELTFGGQ